VMHPGDTMYLRFDVKGTKIKLAHAGPEKDDAAQVIFAYGKEVKEYSRTMKVENKFANDFVYKVEVRSLRLNHQMRVPSSPVVANKVAFDTYPMGVEEVALFDFKLEP
ncbi:MAG: hypothetical protein ABUL65_03235, partial [Opitutus sp.]